MDRAVNVKHPRPGSLLLCMLLPALAGAAAARAEAPEPPPYYAIEGARVVTGTGSTLESATVLLADGLIEGVGVGLEIPADAWVIDGAGLTVFPGLIDGLTTLGQKPAEDDAGGPPGRGGGFGADAAPPRGPEDRPRTTPWASAAEMLGDDPKVEKWRQSGFTAALSAPGSGLFAGQAALIHLGDAEPRQRVLAGAVAQRLNFDTEGFGAYPGSLMGVLSYVRQVLSDTGHYRLVEERYEAAPLGRERPEYDRALEALATSLDGGQPFLVPGDLGREIDRALALGAEYELATVVYGGRGGYDRAERLAEAGAAVLVSLDWPKEEADRDPDADTPFRELYHRRLAPSTPAALARAGVPFAFYSDGLSSPTQIFESVRKAVAAGLSDEAALAALTSAPAEIFEVADRLGTIERGKIANLVVATAEPWAEGAEIRMVFVDGRKYEERGSDEPVEAPAADVSGTWTLTVESPRGSREMSAQLTMAEDGKVTGELTGESGASSLDDGRMSGELLRFKVTRDFGGRSVEASYSLAIAGESANGTMSAGPMTMDVSGERTALAASTEDEGDESAAEAVDPAELEAAMALYQGPAARLDTFAVVNATVYTVSGETIEGGTVLVRDGKIRAVGREVAVPAGAMTFDAAGGALIPGIIDAHSHTAAEGGVNEGSLAVTAMVGIADVLDPDDVAIYRALAGGVTTANILHGSANPIGGKNQVIKLRWGADAEGLMFAGAPPGIKFALGENPKRSNFRRPGMQRYPQTRMGVMDVIREALTEARAYREEWDAYRAAGKGAIPPRRDLKLEALAEILSGERLVHAHCYRADEILQLLRLAEEFGFRVATLQHVLEGYKVADEIAAHGAGASTFSDWWGYKVEAYDAIPYNAALMAERGVVVSINSDSDEEMRHLNQEAAKAVKWGGMSENEALKLVTLNPAIQLGIADRVGSIEVGKDADLVLYDGPPLAVGSVVLKTFVDGDLYFDREADRRRLETIDGIKKRLLPAEKTPGDETPEDDGGAAPPETEFGSGEEG